MYFILVFKSNAFTIEIPASVTHPADRCRRQAKRNLVA